MPVHTITFNLPDEREELQTTLNAGKMCCVISDFKDYLRSQYKYQEPDNWDNLEKIRDRFFEICHENGFNSEEC